ncbi:YHYH domain-containing protein [Paenibacillus sp. RC67]|uniref:YHYH domain-containing protein n=1 Tax=Paenibacillus sp. RC67 TaxID=3039392 RepID=UPI0024AD2A07|nr:YHYH domain-containing protein [Paenibacillus sp. RC67]
MKFTKAVITLALLTLPFSSIASAHPGRTDSNGGHTCRTNCAKWGLKNGEYHYHNGSGASGFFIGVDIPKNEPTPSTSDVEEIIPYGHVKVTLPTFKVYINYKTGASDAQNSTLEYPFFLYNDIIYAPLNYDMCSTLTIENTWSNEVGLSLRKTDTEIGEGVHFQRIESSSTQPTKMYAHLPTFNIFVNDVWVDNENEEYPFLVYKDVTYYPMTWHLNSKFGLTTALKDNRFDIFK